MRVRGPGGAVNAGVDGASALTLEFVRMRIYIALSAVLAAMFAGCAVGLALLVDGGPPSLDGEDEGPPQVFRDLDEAEKAAGYRIPFARDLTTWRLSTVTVVPANSGRKELREAGYSILAGEGPSEIQKQLGVRNYVQLKYELSPGREVTVTVNVLLPERHPNATPPADVLYATEQVTLGGVPVTLDAIQFRGGGTTLYATWQRDGVPFTCLAILDTPTGRGSNGVSKDALLELIAAIR